MEPEEVRHHLDALLEDLRDEGRVDSAGRFTLDPDNALAKLRQYQLADPRQYILWLVSAAVRGGATSFQVLTGLWRTCVEFDGDPVRYDELSRLLEEGILQESSRAGDLATAVGAALGLGASEVILESSGHGRLRLSEDANHLDRLPADETSLPRVRFLLVYPGGVLGLLTKKRELDAEDELLSGRCRWARVPITVNRKWCNPPPRVGWSDCPVLRSLAGPDPLPQISTLLVSDFHSVRPSPGPFGAVVGLSSRERESELEMIVHGVAFARTGVNFGDLAVRALVISPDLALNLSRSDVAENETYGQVIAHLRDQALQMRDELIRRLEEVPDWRRPECILLLERQAARWALQGEHEKARALRGKLAALQGESPLFNGMEATPQSVRERLVSPDLDPDKCRAVGAILDRLRSGRPVRIKADLRARTQGWLHLEGRVRGGARLSVHLEKEGQAREKLRLEREGRWPCARPVPDSLPLPFGWECVELGLEGRRVRAVFCSSKDPGLKPQGIVACLDSFLGACLEQEKIRLPPATPQAEPEPAARPADELPCPVCRRPMQKLWLDAVLDRCLECGGVWFDGGELQALAHSGSTRLSSRAHPPGLGKELDCPRCRIPLGLEHQEGGRVMACKQCGGLWVDRTCLRARLEKP